MTQAREETGAPPAACWAETLLLVARRLGIDVSPGLVRVTTAWAEQPDSEQAILGVASAAGLAGQFVELQREDLGAAMLPALLPVGAHQVGAIVAVDGPHATVVFPASGQPVERAVPLDQLGAPGALRLLLVHQRGIVRDRRVDEDLPPRAGDWFREIFVRHRQALFELGLGSLAGNLLAVSTSLFAMQVWDRVVPARSIHTLWVLASGVALALLLEFLIRTARVSIADHFGKQTDLRLSAMFFARVLDIRNDARPRSTGTLIAQLRDLEQMRELLTSTTLGVLIDLPFVAAFLVIIWILGGPLVLVPLAAVPLLVLPGLAAQWPLARLSQEGLQESALRNAVLMEAIYRVEDIKLLQAEPRFRSVWDRVNETNGEIGLKQRFLAGLLVNGSQTVQQVAYAGVLVVGVYGILDGSLSFGAVLACSILTSRTIAPLAQIAAVLGRIQNARIGKRGLDQLLSLPVDHDPARDAYHKPALAGHYRFEDVSYAYGPQERTALAVARLKIEPGERIAVLGRVGAGKSTLLRLAAGLATPGQGRILLDDTPMPLIDVADLRRDVGFVPQEAGLFYGTLRENLRMARPQATDEEILAALRIACADQLLLNQPHGLDLPLREGGAGLSGGQKQALLLARTFLRAPNVLLLDEPTASLDEATEFAVIERMKAWLGPRTLVVATHRYALLSLVDRIVVVDGGRVVRDGPKAEILGNLAGALQRRASAPAASVAPTKVMP